MDLLADKTDNGGKSSVVCGFDSDCSSRGIPVEDVGSVLVGGNSVFPDTAIDTENGDISTLGGLLVVGVKLTGGAGA